MNLPAPMRPSYSNLVTVSKRSNSPEFIMLPGIKGTRIRDRAAARSLMRVPFIPGNIMNSGLFDLFETVTKLLYEGRIGAGRFILAEADDPNLSYVLRLASPVSLRQARWLRKLMQMATLDTALVIGYDKVFGLGSLSDVSAPPYVIDVTGRHAWALRHGENVLMRVRDGRPGLA